MKRHEFEKNARILTDVMGFCHSLGARHFQTDFQLGDTESNIRLVCEVPGALPEEKLSYLQKILNTPRQREIEQSFWNISSEHANDGDLGLAGVMVDSGEVAFENGVLSIHMRRLA